MTGADAAAPAVRRTVPAVVPAVIAGAWLLAIALDVSGRARFLHHDALLERGPGFWLALPVFFVAWQLMVAAMMLPSSVPMVGHFRVVAARQQRPRNAVPLFLAGYAVVWTAFGVGALVLDLGIHRDVDSISWLSSHPWVIAGGALALAGAFQFSSLKDRCLTVCRQPPVFLVHQQLRGVDGSFRLGLSHGLYCLGCCWALMLLMFAAGVANLAWMAALTGVMVIEKVGRQGARLSPVVGVVLLAWAVLVLVHPTWLPHPFAGGA